MSQVIFGRLEKARDSLRACLAVVDGKSPEDVEVGQCFDAMRVAFEELGDLALLWDDVEEGQEDQLQEALEELMRLNGVLTRVIQRDEERLLADLAQAKAGRQGLEALRRPPETGGTCDMSA